MINEELLQFTSQQIRVLGPQLAMLIGINLVILISVVRKWQGWDASYWAACAALIVPSVMTLGSITDSPVLLFNGMMVIDQFSQFFTLLILLVSLCVTWTSRRYLKGTNLNYPEYYILILFSTFGMILMSSTLDLIVMFIALEIMSLSVYTLVAFKRESRLCNESAVKYFITGAVASAVYLFGTAHIYGSFGTFKLPAVLELVQQPEYSLPMTGLLGITFVIIGFLIKVAAAPFHMWMPDVYEGAITPVTGFMTTALKAAVFVALIRITIGLNWETFLTDHESIESALWGVAIITMVAANVTALSQTNLKRMLGYSSIAHTGYLILGFISVPASQVSYPAIAAYLVGYVIMNLGAFTVLSYLAGQNDEAVTLDNVAGLSGKSKFLSFALATFMFSLAGIPPTVGFISKYYLFYAGVEADKTILVLIAVLCSAVSAYYYLRVIVYMYMRPAAPSSAKEQAAFASLPWSTAVPVASLVLLTIILGMFPAALLEGAKQIMAGLTGRI